MNNNLSRLLTIFAAFVIIGGTFSFGYSLGAHQENELEQVTELHNKSQETEKAVDFSPYWRAWNVINEKFVPIEDPTATSTEEETVTTTQEKVWGSIKGLVRSLDDPHTVFLPPRESKTFEDDISGNFEGVGMEIGLREEVLTVVAPLTGTPAERAGIQSQDKILEIDGESTEGMSVEEAVQTIRGEAGTTVTFTIAREGESEPLTIPVTRGTIDIPIITTSHQEDDIFVIKLHSFTQQAPFQFQQAMKEFIRSDRERLILDLRQNPGGILSTAVNISGYFLPEGSVVVREDFGDKRAERVYRSPGKNFDASDLDMVVLVDRGSASASEILAGALREHGVATLVGQQTFGKGSVQELVDITRDPKTSLKVTVARWLTPNEVSISKDGLEPDIKVERTPEQFRAGEDPQMERAVEVIQGL